MFVTNCYKLLQIVTTRYKSLQIVTNVDTIIMSKHYSDQFSTLNNRDKTKGKLFVKCKKNIKRILDMKIGVTSNKRMTRLHSTGTELFFPTS